MAIYAIEMTKLEANIILVMLQPGSSEHFSENYVIMKYEVDQSSINSLSFIVFHYYLQGDVAVAHYTTRITSFHAEIKMLQFHFIFFEDNFFKLMKVKGDGSCLYNAIVSHIM